MAQLVRLYRVRPFTVEELTAARSKGGREVQLSKGTARGVSSRNRLIAIVEEEAAHRTIRYLDTSEGNESYQYVPIPKLRHIFGIGIRKTKVARRSLGVAFARKYILESHYLGVCSKKVTRNKRASSDAQIGSDTQSIVASQLRAPNVSDKGRVCLGFGARDFAQGLSLREILSKSITYFWSSTFTNAYGHNSGFWSKEVEIAMLPVVEVDEHLDNFSFNYDPIFNRRVLNIKI